MATRRNTPRSASSSTGNPRSVSQRPHWFSSFCQTSLQFLHIDDNPGTTLEPFFVYYCSVCGSWIADRIYERHECCDSLMWFTHSFTQERVLLVIHCSTCHRYHVSETPRMLPWTRCCNQDQMQNLRFLHLRDLTFHNVQLISYNGDEDELVNIPHICKLKAIAALMPTPLQDVPDLCNWLNSFFQRAHNQKINIFETFVFNEVASMWSYKLQIKEAELFTYFVVYGPTKTQAKCKAVTWILSNWKCTIEYNGDAQQEENAISVPTTRPTPVMKMMDTTAIESTNPVAEQEAPPQIMPLPFPDLRPLSHSVPNHEYATLQKRANFFERFNLSSTDVLGQTIATIKIPEDLLAVEGATSSTPFLNHAVNATDVKFYFKVNPAPNQSGLYIITHIPLVDIAASNWVDYWKHPNMIIQRQGFSPVLDLGMQNDAEYLVPFEACSNFIIPEQHEDPTSAIRNHAELYVICISPLRTGDGDIQTIPIAITYQIEKAHLNAMRYTLTPTASLVSDVTYNGGSQSIISSLKNVWSSVESIPVIGSIADFVGEVIGHAAIGVSSLVSSDSTHERFVQNMHEVGIVGGDKNKGKGETIVNDLIDGMDAHDKLRRSPAQMEINVQPRAAKSLSNAGTDSNLHRLGLHSNIQAQPMASRQIYISKLAQIPNLMVPLQISTSMSTGTLLAEYQVGALNSSQYFSDPRSSATRFGGPLSAIFASFHFYSGKKKFKFRSVKTAFHKFSIAVCSTPLLEVPDVTNAGSQYWTILDFGEQNEQSYDCPYVDKFITRCSNHTSYKDDSIQTPFYGTVSVYLYTPLVITGNSTNPIVSSVIDLLVTEEMCEGFEASSPSMVNRVNTFIRTVIPTATEPTLREETEFPVIEYNSGPSSDIGKDPVTSNENKQIFGVQRSLGTMIHTGDSHDCLNVMLNRYTYSERYEATANQALIFPLLPATLASSGAYITWQTLYIQAFMFGRGSLDVLILSETDVPLIFASIANRGKIEKGPFTPYRIGSSIQMLNGVFTDLLVPKVNPVLELTLGAYMKPNKIYLPYVGTAVTGTGQDTLPPDDQRLFSAGDVLVANESGEPFAFRVFGKLAADYELTHFMGFPPMTITGNAAPPAARFLNVDGVRERLHTLSIQHLKQMASARSQVTIEVCFKNEKIISSREILSRREIQSNLLAAGVESNPGPSLSKFSYLGDDEDFQPGVFRRVLNFPKTAAAPFYSAAESLKAMSDISAAKIPEISESIAQAGASVQNTSKKIDEAASKFETLIEKTEASHDALTEKVTSLYNSITSTMPNIPDPQGLWQALLHLVHIMASPTKKTIGISLVGVLTALRLIPTSMMAKANTVFGAVSNWWNGSPEENSEPTEYNGSPDDSAWENIAAFIISTVACVLGYKLRAGEHAPGIIKSWIISLPTALTTTSHIARFFQHTMTLFKKAYKWVVRKLTGTKDLEFFIKSDEFLTNFVRDANLMIDPNNREAIKSQPKFRAQFWTTVLIAHWVRNTAAKNVTLNKSFTAQLYQICSAVIKLSQELALAHRTCPVRYEPFVIQISGPTNIGKSFMVEHLVSELLKSIKYEGYSYPIYTRPTGNAYWPGVQNEPVVLFDDFGQVTDSTNWPAMLAEFYGLKTTAPFTPNMAHLDQKELKYNPYVVILTSNSSYPTYNCISDMNSFYRRRELLVQAEKKEEFKKYASPREIPASDASSFNYLQVQFANKPGDKNGGWGPKLSFQAFVQQTVARFVKYHQQEQKNVSMRIKKLQESLPDMAAKIPEGVDPFSLFYMAQLSSAQACPSQGNVLPSQTLFDYLKNSPSLSKVQTEAMTLIEQFNKGVKDKLQKIPLFASSDPPEVPPETTEDVASSITLNGDPPVVPDHLRDDGVMDEGEERLSVSDLALMRKETPPIIRKFDEWNQTLHEEIAYDRLANTGGVIFGMGPVALISNISLDLLHVSWNHLCDPIRKMFVSGIMKRIEPKKKCTICLEVKPCSWHCGAPFARQIHYYCDGCARTASCVMRDGHPIRRNGGSSISGTIAWLKRLLAVVALGGHLTAAWVWNFLRKYCIVFDFMFLFSTPFVLSYFLSSEVDSDMKLWLQDYVDQHNEKYGTDYKLVEEDVYGAKTYYAVSQSDPTCFTQLNGEEEEFHDCSSSQGATSKVKTASLPLRPIMTLPQSFHTSYKDPQGNILSTEVTLYHDDVPTKTYQIKCQHSRIKSDWDYVVMNGVGQWTPPITSSESMTVEDTLCITCYWTKQTRCRFLIDWAMTHCDKFLGETLLQEFPSNFTPKPQPTRFEKLLEWISSFKLKKWWDYISSEVSKYGRLIMFSAGALGLVAGVFGLVSWWRKPEDEIDSNSYASGRTSNATGKSTAVSTAVSYTGSSQREIQVKKWCRNACWIRWISPNGKLFTVKATAIRMRWIIMTKHQYQQALKNEEDGNPVSIAQARDLMNGNLNWRTIRLAQCQKIDLVGYDLVSINLPESVTTPFKNILDLFSRKETMSTQKNVFTMRAAEVIDNAFLHVIEREVVVNSFSQDLSFDYHGVIQHHHSVIGYTGFSGRNSCGGLLFSSDNDSPICGFHFAGVIHTDTGIGYAIPLNRSALENLTPIQEVVDIQNPDEVIEVSETPKDSSPITFNGNYQSLGYISRKMIPYQQAKSKIVSSKISQKLREKGHYPKTEPCCLSSRDPRWIHEQSPYISGCEKHCQPTQIFPSHLVKAVVQAAKEDLLACKPILTTTQIRSYQDVITGVIGVEEYPPIRLDTSVGFPWNKTHPGWDRAAFLQPIRDEQEQVISATIHPDLLAVLNSKQSLRENGIVPATIFWDHLKDERRKPEKARALGGTRIFSLSPLDFLLEYGRYHMDFNGVYHHYRHSLEHAVGIVTESPEWTNVVNRLLTISNKNFLCLDYSNFGPGLNSELARLLAELPGYWYEKYMGQRDEVVRAVMAEEITSPIHLCHSLLYRTLSGIPSGHPGTTILNTEVNKAYIKICYLDLAPKELKSILEFKNNVALCCYGDDLVMSVSDKIAPWFNGISIQQWFQFYKIRVTPATKSGQISNFIPLEEVTFLKRGFLPHPARTGLYLAPIDPVSVEDCAHWIIQSENPHYATQQNCEASVRLAYSRAENYFSTWKGMVNGAIADVKGLDQIQLDWSLIDYGFFD